MFKFSGNRTLRIPDYQRGYAWTQKQVWDLLDDIDYISSVDDDLFHYFGTVVTCNVGNEEYIIIDGQQRITTVHIICSMLENEIKNYDTESEYINKLRQVYSTMGSDLSLNMDSNKRNVFKMVMKGEHVSDEHVSSPSEYNLKNAQIFVDKWLNKLEASVKSNHGDEWECVYLNEIEEMSRVLLYNFKMTEYEVGNEIEAGRMFSVINDRGRDLTLADKVKSYLIYQTSSFSDEKLSNEVYNTFNEVFENVVGTQEDTSVLESFMKYHWMAWSGEHEYTQSSKYDINTVDRRVKNLKKHLHQDRPTEEKRKWIKYYLDSLTLSSKSYASLCNPYERNMVNMTPEMKKKIYLIQRMSPNGFNTLIMSMLNQYQKNNLNSDDSLKVFNKLELLALKCYQVSKTSYQAFGSHSKSIAFEFEWLDNPSIPNELFGSNRSVPDNGKEAVKQTATRIQTNIDKYISNTKAHLKQEDVVGGEFTKNWTGVRDKFVLSYILFEYENHLSDKEHKFEDFVKSEQTLEHIWPENPEEYPVDEEEYNRYVNRLGNFLILDGIDNSVACNNDIRKKWNDVYSKLDMEMVEEIQELCSFNGRMKWNKNMIDTRTDRIVKFYGENW